jgi:hypothetical protein
VIRQIFGGYFKSQIETESGYISNTFDSFLDLSLNIQNVNSLDKAIFNFSKPDILTKENKYKNPLNDQLENAKKTVTIFRAPLVLMIHLKRFSYDGRKINKFIQFEEKLNLNSEEYGLHGIVVHLGSTRNSGHYIAFVKAPNGCWYEMDDSSVHQVSLSKVLSQHVYLLFYSKVIREQEEEQPMRVKKVDESPMRSKKVDEVKNKMESPSVKKTKEESPSVKKTKEELPSVKKVHKRKRQEEEPVSTKKQEEEEPVSNRQEEEEPESKKVKRESFDLDEFLQEKREISWDNAEIIPSPFKSTRKSNSSKKKDKMWDLMYDLGKRKKKRTRINLEDWKKEGKEFQKVYNHKHSL